jgi:hypothetical protein
MANHDDPQRINAAGGMKVRLPLPIGRFVDSENSGDVDAVPECFAADATVRDEGNTYVGVTAIQKWRRATREKYGHTVTPLHLAERNGKSVLTAELRGHFPGSPVTVEFTFVLANAKIQSLEIH